MFDHLVAGAVAPVVVDVFEAVDVEHPQGQRLILAQALEQAAEVRLQASAVGQLGQAVDQAHFAQLPVQAQLAFEQAIDDVQGQGHQHAQHCPDAKEQNIDLRIHRRPQVGGADVIGQHQVDALQLTKLQVALVKFQRAVVALEQHRD
ncbi:hypothetical protein D3C79_776540 [compost metagenome]